MKHFFIVLFIIPIFIFSQNTKWKDYFSFFNVKNIQKVDDKLFCSTEGGLFSTDLNTGEIKKISKVNGLNGVNVVAFNYNQENQTFLIGYSDGKFDFFTPNGIHLNVDIPIDSDFQGNKTINHISSSGNFAVLSMDFGVLYFDIKRREFKETIYFKKNIDYIKVNESIIINNFIYSVTNNGIYHKIIDTSLPDFLTWKSDFLNVSFQNIELFNNQIFASTFSQIWKTDTTLQNWALFLGSNIVKDLKINENMLSVIFGNSISVYDSNLVLQASANFSQNLNTGIFSSNQIFAGTSEFGIISSNLNQYVPDGPFRNSSGKISLLDDKIWIAPTNFLSFFNPDDFNYGFFYFDSSKWNHQKSQSINNATNIMHVVPNPNKTSEVYAICYDYGREGLLKIDNQQLTTVYNHNNSPISLPNHLVGGVFDKTGNLFISERSALLPGDVAEHAILIKNPQGNFIKIGLNSINISQTTAVGFPVLDNLGFLYLSGPRGDGLQVVNYNNTPFTLNDDKLYSISTNENQGNLPTNDVVCVDIDNSETLWIGTVKGLRILKNPRTQIPTGNFKTEQIIIEENGLGEELLRDTQINDIATDKANRKWIATENAGVFYVSEDGKKVYNIFTINNSPLPSNTIKDIEINHQKGIVYFSTPLGTVSYNSDIAEIPDDFNNPFVYPNPVRPGFYGDIIIKNIPNNATVKITDLVGNLLYEQKSNGGIIQWNQRNLKGNLVASGIYLVFMTNFDGSKTGTSKIAIVR